ncbi:MAG: amidohydrolase [Bacillota bacterium]|nr:amidohydrolase [Bacillota bacterium]
MIIKNAVIHTITNGTFSGYDLRIEDGKITNIRKILRVYPREEVIEANGINIFPGFIDAHSHIGLWEEAIGFEGNDTNEMTDPVTPQLRAIDSVNPMDEAFYEAIKGGVTTACVTPGSANVIGGQAAVIRLHGRRVDDMVIDPYVAMKCAFGENPKRVYNSKNKAPQTRMGAVALMRETLFKAHRYMKLKELANKDITKFPEFNIKYESLIPLLKGEVPFKAHAHRADDVFSAIRVAKEFRLKLTLDHCTDGHLIADYLKDEDYSAIVGPSFTSKTKFELKNKTFETPGILTKAGVKVAITTDSPITPLQYLPLCAALAVKSGMSELDALKAITIHPAEILGLGDRLGSIEVGKDADLVFWEGHPFDVQSKVKAVYIKGEKIYEE